MLRYVITPSVLTVINTDGEEFSCLLGRDDAHMLMTTGYNLRMSGLIYLSDNQAMFEITVAIVVNESRHPVPDWLNRTVPLIKW